MRWVHSKAMLADCLTKTMDSSELLGDGVYALFDEQCNLEHRAGKRQSLSWLAARKPISGAESSK